MGLIIRLPLTPGSFSRIAYFLELQTSGGSLQWMYVSFDAAPFSTDPTRLGIPINPTGNTTDGTSTMFHYGTGAPVSVGGGGQIANMNVYSDVTGIVQGIGITTGNAQFWGTNYANGNAFGVPNASGTNFDFGVTPTSTGRYGALQISNYGAGQTLLAFNNWGGNGGTVDLGIGNDGTGTTPTGPSPVTPPTTR